MKIIISKSAWMSFLNYNNSMRKHILHFGTKVKAKDTRSVYYLLAFLNEFSLSLISAVYVLLLLSKGLDVFDVMMVNFAFVASIVLFEIPTGVYADFYGRRKSVILSFVFLIFTFLFYFIATNFWMFVLAEVLAALAITFSSGALDAWVVDSFEREGYTGKIDYVFSNAELIGKGAAIFGGLLGGYIGSINLSLPFGVGGVLMIITLLIAIFFIHEEFVQRHTPNLVTNLQRIGLIAKDSITYGISHKVVFWLMLSSIVFSFAFMPLNMYWSPRMNELVGNQVWILGWVWAGMALFMMLGSFLLKLLLKQGKQYATIMIIIALFLAIPILISSVSNTIAVVISGFLFYEIGRGMLKPAHKTYLNKFIPSSQRATIMSFDSMMARFGAAIGLFVFGLIAKYYGIQISWIVAGFVLFLLIPVYLQVSRHEKRLSSPSRSLHLTS